MIVIANGGPGFCSASPAAYDSFRAGNKVDGTSLYPMCVRVNDFQAGYLNTGQATSFAANIDYQAGADLGVRNWRPYRLEVNHPPGTSAETAHLQGHGYAPTFTVIFPNGEKRTQTVQFQPDNPMTLLSSGTVRVDPPAGLYPDDERRKHQLAITGLFAPTQQMDGKLLSSSFPDMRDPAVAIDIYRGDAGLTPASRSPCSESIPPSSSRSGSPSSSGSTSGWARTSASTTAPWCALDGATPFVNLQVSHDPGQVWVLVSALSMMAGLLVSLVVRRRRVWARITGSADPGTVNVELGGLARTDNSGWGGEFEKLTAVLQEKA